MTTGQAIFYKELQMLNPIHKTATKDLAMCIYSDVLLPHR